MRQTPSLISSRTTTALDRFARLLLAFLAGCGALAILGLGIAIFYRPQPDNRYYELLVFPGTPEPTERAVFIALSLAAPVVLWMAWLATNSVVRWRRSFTQLLIFILAGSIFACEILIGYFSEFLHLTAFPVLSHVYLKVFATILGTAITLYVIFCPRNLRRAQSPQRRKLASLVVAGVLILVGLAHAASRVHTLTTLQVPGWGQHHLDAMLYSITQVAYGKTLLADLPAQYGLYAELLKPAFFSGCTILRFTSLMALFQFVAWLSLLYASKTLIRSNLLFLLAGMALSILIGEMWLNGIGFSEPYYQYWPLRLLFPAIAIVIFERCLRSDNRQRRTLGLLAATAAVGCIWNLDTGVPVFGAMFAYLLSRVILPPKTTSRRREVSLMLFAAGIVISVVALFFVYLRLKAGRPLDWAQLIEYQKIFYTAGINLLPMPISFHPWIIVCGVYLAGLVTYIADLQRREVAGFSSMLFFLSILGIGLFAYYQGRSHEYVFAIVVWPSVLISFALLDRIRRACAAKLLPKRCVLVVAPVVLLATLLAGSSLMLLPDIIRSFGRNWAVTTDRAFNKTKDAVSFIKRNTRQGERVFILSYQQATYFGEARLLSAIDGPGWVEMLLRADRERFKSAILNARDVPVFVDLDLAGSGHIDAPWTWVLGKYALVDCSSLKAIGRIKPVVGASAQTPKIDAGCPATGGESAK